MIRSTTRKTFISVAFGGMLILANAIANGTASAQTRGPRTIAQEMNHLTKELELTPNEQKEIRPLLLEHRQRIQALFDQHPSTPREALRPQIHAISEATHHEIEALLTDRQRQLAKAMQARMHSDNRPFSVGH
jgi:Spy/CpxP family protein refolding chaperone